MSSSGCKSPSASNLASATSTSVRRTSIGLLSRSGRCHGRPALHDHSEVCPPPRAGGPTEGGPQLARRPFGEVSYRLAKEETQQVRRFLAREWPAADRAIFGEDCDWTSRPVVVEARTGDEIVGAVLGEV